MQDDALIPKLPLDSYWRWCPYVTQQHCSPLPSPFIFTLLYVGTRYLQAILLSKFHMEKEIQVSPLLLAWPQTIWSIFIANLTQGLTVGDTGGRGTELRTLLDNFSLSPLPASFPSGQRAFYFSSLRDGNAIHIFFLACSMDFVKLWSSWPDLTLLIYERY